MNQQTTAQLAAKSLQQLELENRELQLRLFEAEETIRAIQTGAVDAFMVDGEIGQQVYTLESADRPYRLVIEQMQQGAATLLNDGTIAYCNTAFAVLLKVPHQKLVGASFWDFVVPEDAVKQRELVASRPSPVQGDVRLLRSDGELLYTYVTFNSLPRDSGATIGVLVTDLTFQRHHEQLSSAHRALQESEARFRQIIDALPTAIYSTDAQGRLTHFNPACIEFSGRMPELGSDKWCVTWKLFHADGSRMTHDACPMAVALKEGRSLRGIEAIAERPDGSRIWFTPHPTPLRNAAGEIVGGINMLIDITERKLTQQQKDQELRDTKLLQRISSQLIHSQDPGALFAQILEAAVTLMQTDKGTIQLYDADSSELRMIAAHGIDSALLDGFMVVSPDSGTSCALALQTRERAIITDFSSEDHRDSAASAAHRAAGVLAAQTTPLLTRSGELLGMLSTHWSRPWEPDERALRMIDILARQTADLIERMRAENALRASEARLETELADTKLLQTLSAQIIHEENVDTLYGKITEAAVSIMQSDFASLQMYFPEEGGPGKLKLLASYGLGEEGERFWEWVDVDRGTTCAVALRTGARFMSSDIQNNEHVVGTIDHAAFVAAGVNSAQTTPLYSRNGNLLGMLPTHWKAHHTPSERDLRLLDILARQAADLIERKKAEDALKQSKVALTDADRRKDEFLATLAHELRNPLAPIRNGLHLMRTELAGLRLDELRDMMDRQVTHLVRLIDDLLDVSRVSQGKIDLRKQRITLQSAVEAATEASRPLIEDSGHRLTLTLPDTPLWLDADLTRIAQVLGNLLNNAAKYTPDGGHITVSAHSEANYAVLSVSDTGVGIPADMLPKVFDLFAQVDRNLERSQGGLGIGLALVRQLVAMHGGAIEAQSEGVDLGSTFTVRLPLAVPCTTPESSAADSTPSLRTPPQHVLVVDDNVPAAETTGWMLEIDGHTVEYAYDAAAALAAAPAFRPDVILLDIGLPGMNGYDLCRAFRQQPQFQRTLIIAQTGWGQERDRQLAHDAGFDHYLVKPVKYEDLEALLARIFAPPGAPG
ncbi:MAG: ATP-binding protein [Gammaproteobacteria bacterium]